MTWETAEYTLKHPVTVVDVEVKKIEMRMPNGKTLRAIEKMKLGDEAAEVDALDESMTLITYFCPNAPEGFVDEMHPFDIKGAGEKMAPLLVSLFALVAPEQEEAEQPEQPAAMTEPGPVAALPEPEQEKPQEPEPDTAAQAQAKARAAALAEARGEKIP